METESDSKKALKSIHLVEPYQVNSVCLTAYEIPATPRGVPIILEVTGVKALVNGLPQRATVRFHPGPLKGYDCTVRILVLSHGYLSRKIEVDFDQVKADFKESVKKYEEAKQKVLSAHAAGATGENFDQLKEHLAKAAEGLEQMRRLYNDDARTAEFDKVVFIEYDESPNITKDKSVLVLREKTSKIKADDLMVILRQNDLSPEVKQYATRMLKDIKAKGTVTVAPPFVPVLAQPASTPAPPSGPLDGMLDDPESPMEQELRKLAENVPPSPTEQALAKLTEDVPEPTALPAPQPEKGSELVLTHRELDEVGIPWESGPVPLPKDPWAWPSIVAEASEPEPRSAATSLGDWNQMPGWIKGEEDVKIEPVDDVPPELEVTDNDIEDVVAIEAAPVDQPAQREPDDEEGDEADEINEAIIKGVQERTVPDRTDEPFVEPAFVRGERQTSPAPGSISWRETASPAQKFLHRHGRIFGKTKRFLSQTKWASAVIVILLLAMILYKRGPDWLEDTKNWTKRTYASVDNKAKAVTQDAKETVAKATDWTKRSYDSASDKAKAKWKDTQEKIAEATATKPEPPPMPTVAPTIVAEAPEPLPYVPLIPLPMPRPEPTPQPEAVAQAKPTPAPEPKPAAVAKPEPKLGRLYASVIGRPQVDELGRYIVEVDGQLFVANTTISLDNGRLRHSDLEPFRP